MAKVIAMEVGHNWGQQDHVCQTYRNQYSISADGRAPAEGGCGAHWDRRYFWLHYGDSNPANAPNVQANIIFGTMGYD